MRIRNIINEPSHFSKSKKNDFLIVLDLDMTLIYSTIEQPLPGDTNYIKLKVPDIDSPIYVYKRPYLD